MFKAVDTILDLNKAGFKQAKIAAKPKHYAAIGKFVSTIGTEIDARLKNVLQKQVDTGETALGPALVGDMRLGDVMGTIRRIAESRSLPAPFYDDMNALFTEISNLRQVRNVVAHQTCLVRGNALAFHNIGSARTESAIEVTYWKIKELNELSEYAERIGWRILLLFRSFIPTRNFHERNQLILTFTLHSSMAQVLIEVIKGKKLPRPKLEDLKVLNMASHEALMAYSEALQKADGSLGHLKETAERLTSEFTTAVLSMEAPTEAALREIPPRLRNQDRSRAKNAAPKRKRQRRS